MEAVSLAEMQIELVGYSANAMTGHLEIHVRSHVPVGANEHRTGPMKTYGIDPDSLKNLYDGDVNRWLAHVKQEHQRFCGIDERSVDVVRNLKGKFL